VTRSNFRPTIRCCLNFSETYTHLQFWTLHDLTMSSQLADFQINILPVQLSAAYILML